MCKNVQNQEGGEGGGGEVVAPSKDTPPHAAKEARCEAGEVFSLKSPSPNPIE